MYIFIANSRLEKILDFKGDVDFIFKYAYEYPKEFLYLSNIDPYWMTVFNKLQIEWNIINELSFIKDNKKETIDFIDFLKKVEQHDFLVLIWD
jgi:hypothetical protein